MYLLVYACSAGEALDLVIGLNPDQHPESGDESVIWRIRGDAVSRGLMEIKVGSVPDGFREITPMSGELNDNTRYTASLQWDRLDQGISFVPSELPRQGVARAGHVVSIETFREDGADSCS